MGVQGLWDLVAPAGRRIKIQNLEGKVLAIDVSIWLLRMLHGHISMGSVEFKNIHLIGILKRVIKLMFYGIKPVFVFDGKFPDLKKETVHKRQLMREFKKRSLKKVAEKFLTKVLESRIKETIEGLSYSKKGTRNSGGLGFNQQAIEEADHEEDEDDEQYYDDTEENKQERRKRKKEKKREKKKEEEKEKEKDDAMLYDYEFDLILEENKDLLIESGVDLDEFYKQDTGKQYDTIRQFRNRMRERKMKKYLSIDNLDEFSKTHIQDYVKNCIRKHKVQQKTNEANAQKMTEVQENVLGNVKYTDFVANEYMKTLFLDPKKNVMQKTLASNRNKGFIYINKDEGRSYNNILKLGSKRQSKFEKSKKLAAKLKAVRDNAEHGPTYFSFEELLCDNPVDAFKYHLQKTDPLSSARPLVSEENQDEQDSQPKRSLNKNIDVDDVFGFSQWDDTEEQNKPDSPAKQKEEKPEVITAPKAAANEEEDEDLMDLFEYNVEDSLLQEEYVKPQGKVNNDKESPETKIRKLESETTTTSGSKSAEKEDPEEEGISPGKRVKVIQTKKEIKEIQMKNGQELKEEGAGSTSMSIFERLEARAKGEKEAKQQETIVPVVPAKPAAIDEREAMITKTVQRWLGLGGKDSVKKKEVKPKNTMNPVKELVQETVENYAEKEVQENPQMGDEECFFKKVAVEDLYVPNPDAVFIWSEDSNQKKIKKEEEVEEAPVKEEEVARQDQDQVKEEVFAELMEILYDKEPKLEASAPKEEEESFQGPTEQLVEQKEEENTDSNMLNIMGPEENYDDMNEADLMARMKELEEDDMTDKWALMDQFQKFQNLSDLEGGSIQDKLREIKELLIMLGVPWVDSPSEAEAQCSYLEMNGLVDGVITDDSDVFLFGARHVYRNMFDKGDYAHSFQMRNIEKDMGLDRSKLILMALFLGSDYTLGVRGVGIVNAIEIVRAFETPEALERFKAWAEMPDVFMEDASVHYKDVSTKELEYKLYHRNFKKHWELPENFPDYRVVEAYEKPAVDLSLEKFEWGTPDVENLESMCSKRFAWDEDKIKNTLEPLKKAIKERKGQKRITDFFREDKIAEINSKRINKAVSSLQTKGERDGDALAEHTEMIEKKIQKQNVASLKRMPTEDTDGLEGFAFQKKKTKKTAKNVIH